MGRFTVPGMWPPRIARTSSPANSLGVRASTIWVPRDLTRSSMAGVQSTSPAAAGDSVSATGRSTVAFFTTGLPAACQASRPPWKTLADGAPK